MPVRRSKVCSNKGAPIIQLYGRSLELSGGKVELSSKMMLYLFRRQQEGFVVSTLFPPRWPEGAGGGRWCWLMEYCLDP